MRIVSSAGALLVALSGGGCGLLVDLDPHDLDASSSPDAARGRDAGPPPVDAGRPDAEPGDSGFPPPDARVVMPDAQVGPVDADVDAGIDAPMACRLPALAPPPAGSPAPLLLGDLVDIEACAAPSLDVGFRCKAYTFCAGPSSCHYVVLEGQLGHVQSSEDLYYDGVLVTPPAPVSLSIGIGANSACEDPVISIAAGDFLRVRDSTDRSLDVWLPAWSGRELTLFVAADGTTYFDAALTMPAGARP